MLLTSDNRERVVVGGKETASFQIAATHHMFEILSSRLYSDPIGSIVRELYTNAMEVTTPTSKRPSLSPPTTLFPEFVLRDYGPGLSHADMTTIYISAGTSTKNTSNDSIGAFGLGSKSPFAYTDSYTIISYNSGHESRYLVHKTDDGLPSLTLVYTRPTTEPSGLEIRIPSKVPDYYKWSDAIKTQLREMPIKPVTSVEIEPLDRVASVNNVHVTRDSVHSYLVMGGPIYTLDRLQLRQATGWDAFYTQILIEAPIGAVDLTPSREQLLYSKKTIDYLASALKDFRADLSKEITAEFDRQPTFYEACCLRKKYTEDGLGNAYKIPSRFVTLPTHWKGKELQSELVMYEYEHITHHPNPHDPKQTMKKTEYLTPRTFYRYTGNKIKKPSFSNLNTLRLDTTLIIARTTDTFAEARYLTYINAPNPQVNHAALVEVPAHLDYLIDKIKQDFVGFDFIEMSTLPPYTPPPRASNARSKVGKRTLPKLAYNTYKVHFDSSTATTTWDAGGFFLLSHGYNVIGAASNLSPANYADFARMVYAEAGGFPTTGMPDTYIVPPNKKESFLKYNAKTGLWTNMNDHLITLATAAISAFEVIPPADVTAFQKFRGFHEINNKPWIPAKLLQAHTEYCKLYLSLEPAQKLVAANVRQAGYIAHCASFLGLTNPTYKESQALKVPLVTINDFNTKYPLYIPYREILRELGYYNDPAQSPAMQKLINLFS